MNTTSTIYDNSAWWLALAIVTAGLAEAKGRRRWIWFVLEYGAEVARLVDAKSALVVEKIALFSEKNAVELDRPELVEHTQGFRRDAAFATRLLRGG